MKNILKIRTKCISNRRIFLKYTILVIIMIGSLHFLIFSDSSESYDADDYFYIQYMNNNNRTQSLIECDCIKDLVNIVENEQYYEINITTERTKEANAAHEHEKYYRINKRAFSDMRFTCNLNDSLRRGL
jgi:hypothetical protein